MEFLPNSRIFQTSDVDEAEAFTSRLWDSYKISIIEGPFGLCWNQAKLGGTHLSYVEHNCATKIKGGESRSDNFRLILPQTGALRNRLDGVVAEAGKMVFTCYGPELELDIDNCKLLLVSLNPRAVWSALGQRFQKLPPIQGWHSAPASSAAVQALQSMAMWLGPRWTGPGLHSRRRARLVSMPSVSCSVFLPNAWPRWSFMKPRRSQGFQNAMSAEPKNGSMLT